MAFFHRSVCISPQDSFPDRQILSLRESVANLLRVVEPEYPGIPAGVKRRMGKSVRMAVGAALPLMENNPPPDGMVIATANGGMEDCISFLNQILEYNEGLLTPGHFVQSTSNAAAAQIALVTKNHNYNITHVHRGLAFENAMMDVMMLLNDHPEASYLLGCTDEISSYNYNIDRLAGWFRNEPILNRDLFNTPAKGTLAGEGAMMVWMNNQQAGASATLRALKTIHTTDQLVVRNVLNNFLADHFGKGGLPDLLLSGENGDENLLHYFESVETELGLSVPVARFKHLCGEYCTASSFACWTAIGILNTGEIPSLLLKKGSSQKQVKNILIYNTYRGMQHSFIIISSALQ